MSFINELKRRNVFRVGIAYSVVAWLILQVTDVVLNNVKAPDWVFHVILLVLAIGLPLIIMFAWAFEMTPDGLKREKEVDRSRSITLQTSRKLDYTIIAVLTLALGYFVFDKFVISDAGQSNQASSAGQVAVAEENLFEFERSIAVLPLANRSAREEDLFFADGMHDDLLTQLSKISSLKVISRTSVMRFRDTELPIPEIARQLGVNTILEGGIQRSGDQVRINVQLIEADTDKHLWAETYDRRMTAENLFAIQSDITQRIIEALKATLTPEEAARIDERPTDSLEAFQELMKGQQLLALRTGAAIEEAKSHFERAIELDENFSAAVVGLANTYHLLFEYAGWSKSESLDRAYELVERALEISPNLGEALMVRGELHRHRDELGPAEADFERAMELIPGNPTVLHWYSFVKTAQEKTEDAEALLRRAHQLDPMSAVIHLNYAILPFHGARDEETLAELERVKLLHPEYPATYSNEAWVHWSHGDSVSALRALLKAAELNPAGGRRGYLCWNYYNLNALESARDCIANNAVLQPTSKAQLQVTSYLLKGERDLAQAVFEAARELEWWPGGLATLALETGNYLVARESFEERFGELMSDSSTLGVDVHNYDNTIDIALVLIETGNPQRAEKLLDQALELMRPIPRNRGAHAYGFLDVKALALKGEREQALLALEKCAELEYLSEWSGLKYLPHYDSIRGDPRFDAAVSRLSGFADEARDRAAAEGLL